MANFIVSYDLNGSVPSHKQFDDHLEKLGATRGRILETVWYVGWAGSLEALFKHVDQLMSANDRLAIVEASDIVWRNLLIADESLQQEWPANR